MIVKIIALAATVIVAAIIAGSVLSYIGKQVSHSIDSLAHAVQP